jgi:glutathione peroxidase
MPELATIPLDRIDGSRATLGDFLGQVLLVVNVASKCGLTPQYDGLEALYRDYREQGLTVLGFPANDFAGQEPGSNEEVLEFCRATFGVDFPMFGKITVRGPDKHPLYAALTSGLPVAATHPESQFRERLEKHGRTAPPGEVLWNFEKFLIGRDGRVIGRFAPDVKPQDPLIVSAIEAALAD